MQLERNTSPPPDGRYHRERLTAFYAKCFWNAQAAEWFLDQPQTEALLYISWMFTQLGQLKKEDLFFYMNFFYTQPSKFSNLKLYTLNERNYNSRDGFFLFRGVFTRAKMWLNDGKVIILLHSFSGWH